MATNRNYFQKFPLISYQGYNARNIMARVKLLDVVRNNELVLMPYTVQAGERPDTIAAAYYGDPFYAWAILLANDIVDPYHDWYKSEQDMNNYLIKKYGSLQEARDDIIFYKVNWATGEEIITPTQYAALPDGNAKYWSPNFGFGRNVISYRRKELDWTTENNRLDLVTVVQPTNTYISYTAGERVYQYSNTRFQSVKGTIGSVVNTSSNTTHTTQNLVMRQTDISNSNIFYYITNTGNYFSGQKSGANGTVSSQTRIDNTASLVAAVSKSHLTTEELVYWSSVNALDYEHDLNEQRREIKVLDKSYIFTLENNLEDLMK